MARKDLIARGVGFAPGSTKFMPTLGMGSAPVVAPVNVTVPVITGSPVVGSTLHGSNGTWLNVPTSFTYQWYRDGVLIAGATTANYTAVAADIGHALTIAVTASNVAGSATATSLPTALVTASAAGTGDELLHDWYTAKERREEEEMIAVLCCLGALDVL